MTDVRDPYGTLRRALWIGGAQWAGKSTVAQLVAEAHGLTVYHYDWHDARGHQDRRVARRVAAGVAVADPAPDLVWSAREPEEMAAEVLAGFPDRFGWVRDDLGGLFSVRPVLAEGWGLRPELVAPLLDTPRRMVVLVPTEEFRQHQLRTLPRAGAIGARVSDPGRAQANRVARDRLVAEDAVRGARRLGVRVIEVDGTRDAPAVAALVAEQFAPWLAA
ncbi:hypothetical protein OU787_01540 [Kitasatospora sp. YST-16]|uniref:hypothetical protein n=1 Tax=Kitasatospora sp. YST-16 TaxID=2998080 RepID=UPI002284BF35|nr:hypothetical protein [Kitasatospora sp. YST-16]WAL70287.1 hypothetical protein OU787_01540 [Kitasatospora sp. YST-16]WNW36329.1 hypothetical protein RKE32_01555 [Streptomyces sp. Li-HN-5-13]